jgi:acyl dehydratase
MYYLEDFEVGKTRESVDRYIVTEDEIMEVGRRWDPQPFHIDREAASISSFGGLVACSAHLFAIVCWLGHHMEEPIAGVSALGWDEIRLHAPVRPNDEISCKFKSLEARLSKTQPGCGVVRLHNDLFNQRGELVYSADCSFLVLCCPVNEN